jgi:hypothetical protein
MRADTVMVRYGVGRHFHLSPIYPHPIHLAHNLGGMNDLTAISGRFVHLAPMHHHASHPR